MCMICSFATFGCTVNAILLVALRHFEEDHDGVLALPAMQSTGRRPALTLNLDRCLIQRPELEDEPCPLLSSSDLPLGSNERYRQPGHWMLQNFVSAIRSFCLYD